MIMDVVKCLKCGYTGSGWMELVDGEFQCGKCGHPVLAKLKEMGACSNVPVPMIMYCPMCHERHIDEQEFATKPHHTHACQYCGHVWRPAIVPTVGVRFLPGFKNEPNGAQT